jgi:8-oxo-dGTP diphosphatase
MPVFGVRNESLPQKTRSCAYAVIVNPGGRIAAVQENPGRMYLPGGGLELRETPGEAVRREILEELGCSVQLTACIGQSLHYMEADGHCQATYATFYSAELGEKVSSSHEHEHELQWVAAEDFFHPSQSWAAQHSLILKAAELLNETVEPV